MPQYELKISSKELVDRAAVLLASENTSTTSYRALILDFQTLEAHRQMQEEIENESSAADIPRERNVGRSSSRLAEPTEKFDDSHIPLRTGSDEF